MDTINFYFIQMYTLFNLWIGKHFALSLFLIRHILVQHIF